MSSSRYIVGIDLGTTHCAMAYAELADAASFPHVHTFQIPQTINPGVVAKKPLLPSCIYLPAENEFPEESLALPWNERTPRTDKGAAYTIGEFARSRGMEMPGRLVSSAKSWFSQASSKRRNALLPLNAEPDVYRLTPVEASSLILQHLISAWNFELGRDKRGGPLSDQKIVLCVPASFDAAARDLTMEAARLSGLTDVTLLEEPQAAFYAWIAQAREQWRSNLHIGDLILVVDIGGGTTDFSLIAAEDNAGTLALRRIAVGEHILLGGDNMDLALANSASSKLESNGRRLDVWQQRGLALACREAKERLLAQPLPVPEPEHSPSPETFEETTLAVLPASRLACFQSTIQTDGPADNTSFYIRRKPKKSLRKTGGKRSAAALNLVENKPIPIAQCSLPILGRGAAVVGESINASLVRSDAERIILDGFLGACALTERPAEATRSGLRELGLNYAADPSISKHLATFLAQNSTEAAGKPLRPTAVLFNGGVLKSELLRDRTLSILKGWLHADPDDDTAALRELHGADPELAVARGAAFFGRIDAAQGVRISGGVPRSYYVGIESTLPAVPHHPPTVSALCVVPFGMNEGSELDVPNSEFALNVGEPTQFRFFSAAERHDDRIGARVEIRQDAIHELEPIETTIPANLFDEPGTFISVRLHSVITTMGTLELWFRAVDGAGAWKLELNVREAVNAEK